MKLKFLITVSLILSFLCVTPTFNIKADEKLENQVQQRMVLYHEYSRYSNIPWNIIGAIDQYERNTKHYRDYCSKDDELISICYEPMVWSGLNNPLENDMLPYTINLFQGMGKDGNGDGIANRIDPYDRLVTMIQYINSYGSTEDDIKEALMQYYKTEKGVTIIFTIAKLFDHYNTIELAERVFPIPRYYAASYTNNFGTGRSYGGSRRHEGVDIFSYYGTPVVSTSYGVVEIMGWNNYGGYRIGIRDMYNTYQYYAHLNGYAKGLKEGDIVKPGQVIGYVGSTGYGKEGTSGRFPPHLHYGFYKFDGRREWSFNPYLYIRKWPRIKL